jgi:hypothetical protein
LAAFCQQRQAEIIDSLIELLILVVRRIETTANKRVGKQVVEEMRNKVDNKPRLLRRVAQASLNGPEKTIREGIYPVMSQKQCEAIVSEKETKDTYHDRVYLRMRSSYRDHYRRMMPGLLTGSHGILAFFCAARTQHEDWVVKESQRPSGRRGDTWVTRSQRTTRSRLQAE